MISLYSFKVIFSLSLFFSQNNGFDIYKFFEAKSAMFTLKTRLFDAAKRHAGYGKAKFIDKYHTCIKALLNHLNRLIDLLCDNTATQTKMTIIGNTHSVSSIFSAD